MIALCRDGPLDNQFKNVDTELVHKFFMEEEGAWAVYLLSSDPHSAGNHAQFALLQFSTWEYPDESRS